MSATADITTRCPQCGTAFRASISVFNIANGTVRCGSCLWVFNAYEYDIEKPQEVDESWAEELLEEEMESEPPTKDETVTDNDTDNTTIEDNNESSEDCPIEEYDLPDDIDLESIELNTLVFTEDHSQEKRWPWMVGAFCAMLLLTMQFGWLRFDTLSQHEPYRQYYETACHYLPCTVPVRSDIQKIIASHLVVRSHPEKAKALLIDAIIINDADFEQHFPALHLIFRNIHNDIVSSRYFQPHEYLRGDLIDATIIPARQAVQLSLAIVDPGENAINYQLEIAKAMNTSKTAN